MELFLFAVGNFLCKSIFLTLNNEGNYLSFKTTSKKITGVGSNTVTKSFYKVQH